jgi:hypothetical protein
MISTMSVEGQPSGWTARKMMQLAKDLSAVDASSASPAKDRQRFDRARRAPPTDLFAEVATCRGRAATSPAS